MGLKNGAAYSMVVSRGLARAGIPNVLPAKGDIAFAAAEDFDGVADGRGKVAALVVPGVGLTLAHHRA